MTRRLAAAVLVIGGFAAGAEIARACGDKFLIVGGPGFAPKYASGHPSNILVVRQASGRAIDSGTLRDSLGRAGHTVTYIESRGALAQALAEKAYDAVLVDPLDAKTAQTQVASAAGQPQLILVMSQPSAAELAAASQEYACLIKTPDKATNFLRSLDRFLAQRKAARRAAR